MLCGVVTGPSLEEINVQIEQATKYADVLEFRWDCFDSLDFEINCPLPKIFTLRPITQGGFYAGNEDSRFKDLEKLLKQKPDYVDLEYTVPHKTLNAFRKYPVKIILSYHDFKATPKDLDKLIADLKQKPAYLYKIATFANSTLDALRMLNFNKRTGSQVIGLCMGEYGMITRILNHFSYATIDDNKQISPGQLSLEILSECYRFNSINQETAIYGLIGDPVDKSVSHFTHNKVFAHLNENAVYVKMRIVKEELESFFEEIKTLNFKGLSVTMPLKEVVMPFLDEIDENAILISAVNTIVIKDQKKMGFNTDGIGAMIAIDEKMSIKGKNVSILGAGGSAKAIAFTAKQKGAHVTIFNRHTLLEMDTSYDLLINCTPHEMPITSEQIKLNSVIMDIKSIPKWTELLLAAKDKNCDLIFGYDMFVNQALEQFKLWSFNTDHNLRSLFYNESF